jgi:hypothetical protein
MKINVTLGGTFLVDPVNKQYLKPSIEILEVDLDKPIEPQLAQAAVAIDKVYSVVLSSLVDKVERAIEVTKQS